MLLASEEAVKRYGLKPVAKVIDFGVAKATQARLTEKTLFTEYHQLVGTPAYMSPEQAEMSGLDIDTISLRQARDYADRMQRRMERWKRICGIARFGKLPPAAPETFEALEQLLGRVGDIELVRRALRHPLEPRRWPGTRVAIAREQLQQLELSRTGQGAGDPGARVVLRAPIGGIIEPPSRGLSLPRRPASAPAVTCPPHRRARLGIGFCPEGRRVFPELTVAQNLVESLSETNPRWLAVRDELVDERLHQAAAGDRPRATSSSTCSSPLGSAEDRATTEAQSHREHLVSPCL